MKLLRVLAVSQLLLVGCGPKAPPPALGPAPTEEGPEEAMPLQPPTERPGVVPAWADSWPALPPQPGLTTGQELTAALRSQIRFSVEADVSALGLLEGEPVKALLEELAGDPRWKVTRWAGQTVAFLRSRQGTGWSVGWGGYSGSDPLARIALWFGEAPWRADASVNRVDSATAGPSTLSAAGWPVGGPWEGHTGALLAVQGPEVALEIHEVATDLQLVRTAHALSRVPIRLEETVRGLPARHPVAPAAGSTDTVWVAAWDERGLDLRLAVRTETPGWTWVRLVGPKGPVKPALVLRASLERLGVGGAAQAGQSSIPVADLPEPLSVEVWFQADGEEAPRRLIERAFARP